MITGGCADDPEVSRHVDLQPIEAAGESHADARGSAVVRSFARGTDVELEVEGLLESEAYVAHIHNQPCQHDPPGGDHWKRDPDAGEGADNEIHLNFHTFADGTAQSSTHSGLEAHEDMKSIVVHLATVPDDLDMKTDRALCGDVGGDR
ncbi:hypothetical protein [Haloglycomyces albus]|uniref:hypothetical protein n=1 Tax=Haloglycomyces albus TaxID=526067 RepID=UPI0012EC7DF5|nr:hypothetical protein [Haloglycomyces albus]